jgi:hypothetical protein
MRDLPGSMPASCAMPAGASQANLAPTADCCVRHDPLLGVDGTELRVLSLRPILAPLAVVTDRSTIRFQSSVIAPSPEISTTASPPYLLFSTFRI